MDRRDPAVYVHLYAKPIVERSVAMPVVIVGPFGSVGGVVQLDQWSEVLRRICR